MLTLNDGRNELWQWDTGRTLSVDADCSQVHFSNKVFGRSIDVDVVDGVAIIPDILLQTDKELNAWAFVGTAENGYTKIGKTFKVNRRNKPADYVFTPTDQTTLLELVERLDEIEESQAPDAIKNAVDEYLANNPIRVEEKDPTVPGWAKQPTKPKYTAQEVGALSADTVIPTIPDNVSAFRNDAGYLTEHQDISGKLDADKLPEAVNAALAQAKESGEFDGEKGDPGVTPHIGTNGNWYIGTTDTGVKAQGKDGTAGRGIKSIARTSGNGAAGTTDTYTVTYTDNTTSTLTVYNGKNGTNGTSVTVTKVTESTIDGGNNIIEFSDGKTITVKNGSKGSDGYGLTNADKTEIAEEVADMIAQVEYQFMEKEFLFPNRGYCYGSVGDAVKFNNGTSIGDSYYGMLAVSPGETYRTNGRMYYDAPVYLVTNQGGTILIKGAIGSESIVSETFTIPDGGAFLYLNNTHGGSFETFEKEEPVDVSIIAISKSPISYKTIVYDGDSICHGVATNGGYARLIAEKTGGMYVNQAVGGGRLTTKQSGNTHHSVCDNIVNLPTTGDLYCFQGGVNDYWANNVPLGTYSKSDFTGAVDTSTVCGALEYIFRYALTNFLGKPICFIITHKCSGAIYNKNTMGDTFEDYRNAMVGICNKYSIPYYDAFSESGLNGWNTAQKSAYFQNADGCHPTEDGYKHYYVPQLISLFERIMPIE